jgi:hypothetical protein
MVSKNKKSKNDPEEITEEEKQILQQYYNEHQQQQQEEEEPPQQEIKPKRQISDAQRESLARAREIALLKKKELKSISDKKKVIQTLKKEEKKLDVEKEYNETIERVVSKKEPKPEVKERKIKKIIYEDEEEVDENKFKNNNSFSYSNFTKQNAMEQMKDKINEDRLKFLYQKYILR